MTNYGDNNGNPQHPNGRPSRNTLPADITKREILIERLVSNELSALGRSELLTDVENWDNGWRDIALAFIEEQALATAFLNQHPNSETMLQPHGFEGLPLHQPAISQVATTKPQKHVESKPRKHTEWRSPLILSKWAVAATIMFSLIGGILIGNAMFAPKRAPVVNLPHHSESEVVKGNLNKLNDSMDKSNLAAGQNMFPVSRSVLRIPNEQTGTTTEIPLIELDDFTRHWEAMIPKEAIAAFHQKGFRVQPTTHFVRSQISDDRDLLLPIHQLRLTSIVQ